MIRQHEQLYAMADHIVFCLNPCNYAAF
jgi:hypothetical protein